MKHLFALLCLLLCQLPASTARAELPDPTRFSVVLEMGNIAQARAWLEEGLEPNFTGTLIGSGLMIGAWEGNIPLMELFLAHGADINHTNRLGETALMLAAWKNQRTAMQWLLDHGAQPNRANSPSPTAHNDERAWTALHYATFAGHAELVDTLLAAGADVNARSTNGSTVVMMAAREGHPAIAKRLIEAGANPTLKNEFGDDAVAWAMRQGNYAMAKTFTDAENFAALTRAEVAKPSPPPIRSMPAPDVVEEHLRMARLAELQGKRDDALAAYQKALATLKTQQPAQKVGAGGTAQTAKTSKTSKASKVPSAPSALIIRAKRSQPNQQAMAYTYTDEDAQDIDRLLQQARAAETAGHPREALKLYREASTRIKAGQ